jgi:hypothetical protein
MAHANDGGAALDVMDYDARWDKYRIRLGRADLAKHRDLLTELCSRLYAELVNTQTSFSSKTPRHRRTRPSIDRHGKRTEGDAWVAISGVLRSGLPGLCHRQCNDRVSTRRIGTRRDAHERAGFTIGYHLRLRFRTARILANITAVPAECSEKWAEDFRGPEVRPRWATVRLSNYEDATA